MSQGGSGLTWWTLRHAIAVGLVLLFVAILGKSAWTIPAAVRGREQMQSDQKWLRGTLIVLDPGHGGWDPGAVVQETKEKELVLQISQVVKAALEAQGATVILTREADQDFGRGSIRKELAGRMAIVERHSPRVLLSIHANKDSCNCWGAQTFYQRSGAPAGKVLALAVQKRLRELTPTTRVALPANYYVLRTSPVPAAMVEVGFLSNEKERRRLHDPNYQKTLARAISLGLADFFRSEVPEAKADGSIGK
jgi:N-acetylmuramoyl-L-alanine amidase